MYSANTAHIVDQTKPLNQACPACRAHMTVAQVTTEQTGLRYFRTKDFLPSDDKVLVVPLVRDQHRQLFAIKQYN